MTAPSVGADGALRVSIDLTAVPVAPGGAGRYTMDLARVLARRRDVSLTAWCRRDDAPRWGALGLDGAAVRADAPRRRPSRLVWEQLRLPKLVDDADVAVHHGPHYTMPERTSVPCVVTVHDLTFFDHPQWHERAKVRFFRRAIRSAARRAEAVVCVSAYTARRFEELCAPTGRVFVVPHGVDHDVFRPEPGPDDAPDDVALEALGVHEPYVLFLGTLEPRKAVPDLVTAFDSIAPLHPDLSLVLAGRPAWGADAIEDVMGRARSRHRIVRTGYVPDPAVPALLRRAAAVAYPAFEEGFGLPALEALACGAPLVTTAGTAMAEVSGGAALLVPAGSPSDLADALAAAIEDNPDRRERVRMGLDVAAAHTWEASAADHVAAYRWAATRAGDRVPGMRRDDR